MDKNFMPVYTYQLNQIYSVIDAALQTVASYVDDSPSLEYRSWRTDLGAGPIHITISRSLLSSLSLQTHIKIEVDHEKVLDTIIKSDKEINRILQIIRCLNPFRFMYTEDTSPVGVVDKAICDDGCFMEIPDGLLEELPFT
jgi:hypothetical protein